MKNYAPETQKAVKTFDNDEARKSTASFADNAQSFIKDTKKNVEETAYEGTKFLKEEGVKDIRKATDFFKEHPVKSAVYAIGIGALVSYFFIPRN